MGMGVQNVRLAPYLWCGNHTSDIRETPGANEPTERAASRSVRDMGPIPPIYDSARSAACERDFRRFYPPEEVSGSVFRILTAT